MKNNICSNNTDCNNIKIERNIIEILSKPIDNVFIVEESKLADFINHKKDDSKLEDILKKANRISENIVHKE